MRKSKNIMSLLNIISLGVGSIIGAGIFALLGEAISLSGSKTYFAFIIAGVAAIFSGYSYAKLASKYHSSGGLPEYFEQAFHSHKISGTLSFIYVLTSAASISMIAKAFGIYVADFSRHIPTTPFWTDSLAVLIIVLLGLLNMLKVSDVGKSETLFVILKVSIFLLLIFAAFYNYDLAISAIHIEGKNIDFLRSIGITFFAYTGFEVITNATPYVSKPGKTIEQGIYLTLCIVMVLYLALTWVVIDFISPQELQANTETAITKVTAKLLGPLGYLFIFSAAILAFISGINATFFSIYRINDYLAKKNILPKYFNKKIWEQGNLGNFIVCTLIILATLTMDFTSIINLSCAAYLVCYLGIFAANWKLRQETKSSKSIILLGTALIFFILIAFLISLV